MSDLVVGDIVLLSAGDRVPADCLLIEEMDMWVDERIYYPERPNLAEKQASQDGGKNHLENPDPVLLSGSLIMSGNGKAVVLAVGKNTLREKEMDRQILAREKPRDSALEEKLRVLASIVGTQAKILAFVAFILFSIFWLSKLLYTETYLSSNVSLQVLLKNLQIAIALLIVSVPEGMPLAISLAIAFSTQNLKAEYLHVKNNKALEVAGSIEEVVTGKTNTLTTGDMDIATLYIGNTLYEDVSKRGEGNDLELNRALLKNFRHCVLLNTEARMEMADSNDADPFAPPQYFPSGSPVEVGLFKWLITQEKSVPIQSILVERERAHELKTMIPFSTERKRMTVAYGLPGEDQMVRVVVKGAPEYLVPLCTQELDSSNEPNEFEGAGAQGRKHLKEVVAERIARQGQKAITIAYRDFNSNEFDDLYESNQKFETPESRQLIEKDLILLATVGLSDPLKDGVEDALQDLRYV